MDTLVRCCGLVCAFTALTAVAAPRAAAGRTIVRGSAIAHTVATGGRFTKDEVIVRGPVDLSRTDTISRVFECHECTFEGRISAHDVSFGRTVDLSGSTFEGGVDFSGATFHAPALFRGADTAGGALGPPERCGRVPIAPGEHPACFRRGANFSLAAFGDFSSFASARFLGEAAFRDTRFADATFNGADFASPAEFDGAAFRGGALFNQAVFARHASFAQGDFREHTDFSQAKFDGGADFSGAQLASGASFLATEFAGMARFQAATAGGDLNFTFALFRGDRPTANFADLVSAAALVFRNPEPLPRNFRLQTSQLQVRDLSMDVASVSAIEDDADRKTALETIEQSAKARGDLREANDAHYRLQVLKSMHYSIVGHILDYVFYRGVAGYLVRPARPLLVLLALAIALSVARAFVRRHDLPPGSPPSGSRARRASRRTMRRCHSFVTCLLDTFLLLAPRRGADAEQPRLALRLETFTYRLLLVCALLGLANSNPTPRQMVDTLF